MSTTRTGVGTYRPSATFWLMGLLAASWLFLSLDDLLGWRVIRGDRDPTSAYVGALVSTLFLVFLVAGWRVFRVDEEGLEVRSLGRARYAPWAALGGVTTREFRERALLTGIRHPEPTTDPQAFTFYVRDHDGRVFAKVGPWIGKRRALIFDVRKRIRRARED